MEKITSDDLIAWAAGKFYYLAAPYTNPSQERVEWNVQESYEIYSKLISQGVFVHHATYATHGAAKLHKLRTDFEFWKGFNDAFIKPSAGVLIAGISGWRESKGVTFEREEARRYGHPIYVVYNTSPLDIIALTYAEAP